MTPSGWHDDTRSRDAGHDAMQAAVWKYVRHDYFEQPIHGHNGKTYERRHVSVEHPFVDYDGRIVCFADILETFEYREPRDEKRPYAQSTPEMFYRVMEIKPKIYSVGGLIRQCIATHQAIKNWRAAKGMYSSHKVWVLPVVKSDDEKLPILKEFEVEHFAWDGARLTLWRAE